MLDYIYVLVYDVITKGKRKDSPHRIPASGESHPRTGASQLYYLPLEKQGGRKK